MTFSHSSDAITNISTSLKILPHKVVHKSPPYLKYLTKYNLPGAKKVIDVLSLYFLEATVYK